MNKLYLLLSISLLLLACKPNSSDSQNPDSQSADVIIYGGTSAAVTTAVQVAQMGNSVIVVSPDLHLGGLSAGGLGWTDTGDKTVIGGISKEFYHRVYEHYIKPESWNWQRREDYSNEGQGTRSMDTSTQTMWIFEPHVAEQIFEDFIKEKDIKIIRDEWLDRGNGVKLDNGKITSFTTLSGQQYDGKIFIDATYEGDLMAAAGVNYHVGREANSVYGEEWNGVQTGVLHHRHHFSDRKMSPYVIPGDPNSGVLPLISTEEPGIKGEGDNKLQAYCFRLCLTQHAENRIPFMKPDGYDPEQYELLVRIFEDDWRETFDKFDEIPNAKTDVNNHGPMSFDNIGMNYDYPDASYERRREIIAEHETYQKGWLYFIANDPRIPKEVQDEMKKWGYAKDEFTDTGNWPHQIYVREARRMIGEFVMTENEIQGQSPVPHSIGMGSYTMDSHNVQRYITPDGHVQNEGDIGVSAKEPYQIDIGTILPKKDECENLLVPVAVSSSHIAFGSIRMEPVFMILGQSAGTVAGIALDKAIDIHDVTYADLRPILEKDGQVLERE